MAEVKVVADDLQDIFPVGLVFALLLKQISTSIFEIPSQTNGVEKVCVFIPETGA